MPAKPETLIREIEDILQKHARWGADDDLKQRLQEADQDRLRACVVSILAVLEREQEAHADAHGLVRFREHDGPERRGFDVDGLGVFALVAPKRGGKLGYAIYHIPSGLRLPCGQRPRNTALEIARTAVQECFDRAALKSEIKIASKLWSDDFLAWVRGLHHHEPYVPYKEYAAGRRAKGA